MSVTKNSTHTIKSETGKSVSVTVTDVKAVGRGHRVTYRQGKETKATSLTAFEKMCSAAAA